jgi:5-methylcytosine-specific restriction endonuclease McrA
MGTLTSCAHGPVPRPDESLPAARANRIFRRDGFRCVYCGLVFPGAELTVDHVQPRVKRGDHSAGNLVTACAACNARKGGRAAWDYLRDRPADRANFLRYAVHAWARLRRAVEDT